MTTETIKGGMNQFEDAYGILALAAMKKGIQEEDTDERGEFFGELEKILVTTNNQLIDRRQCIKDY